jgi:hypothetical protein
MNFEISGPTASGQLVFDWVFVCKKKKKSLCNANYEGIRSTLNAVAIAKITHSIAELRRAAVADTCKCSKKKRKKKEFG